MTAMGRSLSFTKGSFWPAAALRDCQQPANGRSLNYRPGVAIFESTFFPMLMRGSVE